MAAVNVGAVLDEGRWTGYQKLLVAGTALAIILDGVDNQLLPNALPRLIDEWQMPRTAFNPALSAGPFGMMFGGVVGGLLGDRYGRRTALLWTVVVFAVLTIAVAFAQSIATLAVLRFLAGVGLGGAMPTAAALASEYVPRGQRPFAVTLTIVCIPLGGMLAARMASEIIARYGWQPLFLAGGVVPAVLAVVLWPVLPESPRILAGRRARSGRADGTAPADGASGAARRDVSGGRGRDAITRVDCRHRRAGVPSRHVPVVRVVLLLSDGELPRDSADPDGVQRSGFGQAAANRVLEVFNLGGVVGRSPGHSSSSVSGRASRCSR